MLNSSPDSPQLALHTQPYQASSDRRPSLPVSLYMPKLSVDDAAPKEPLKEQVNNNHKYRSKPKPKEKTGNKRPNICCANNNYLVLNPVLDRLHLYVPNLAPIYMITLLLIPFLISPLLNSCIGSRQAKLPLQLKGITKGI